MVVGFLNIYLMIREAEEVAPLAMNARMYVQSTDLSFSLLSCLYYNMSSLFVAKIKITKLEAWTSSSALVLCSQHCRLSTVSWTAAVSVLK